MPKKKKETKQTEKKKAPKKAPVKSSAPRIMPAPPLPPGEFPLQRVKEVRLREGLRPGVVKNALGLANKSDVARREDPKADYWLSEIYALAERFGVPPVQLLCDPGDDLCNSVTGRAKLVLLMKTANLIAENARQESVRRLAQGLCEQLVDMMPELAQIGAWHSVGKRRKVSELGVAAERGRAVRALFGESSYDSLSDADRE